MENECRYMVGVPNKVFNKYRGPVYCVIQFSIIPQSTPIFSAAVCYSGYMNFEPVESVGEVSPGSIQPINKITEVAKHARRSFQ